MEIFPCKNLTHTSWKCNNNYPQIYSHHATFCLTLAQTHTHLLFNILAGFLSLLLRPKYYLPDRVILHFLHTNKPPASAARVLDYLRVTKTAK